jgi:anti-sigma factor RsiW
LNEPDVPHISPETLEGFVLEKLPPVERTMVERHVATCSSCRAALEHLAAGIRSFGRARLKSRLAESLAAPGQQPAPWGRILSAAAVLVVIAGIGIVYRWFTPGEQAPQVAETMAPVQADKVSRETARPEEPGPPVLFKDKREAPEGSQPRISPAPTPAPAPALTGQTASSKESERSKDAFMENKAAVDAVAESPDVALALSLQPSIWQTGQVAEDSQPGRDERLLKGDQQAMPHAAGAQMQKRQDLAGHTQTSPRAVVRVSPLADLPLTGDADRTRTGARGIPTQIIQSPDSLVFTLYTDLSFEGEALRNARVRQITPDSILLLIGERRISYRLSLQAAR